MAALTVVAVIAAPLIFRLYTLSPAAGVDADVLHDVGTTLTRIFLIQILFYGLTGIANAFLNSRRRFFAAAWSPILPNLIIAATLLSLPSPDDGWLAARRCDHRRPLALDARPRRHRRHRHDGAGADPGGAADRVPLPTGLELAPPGRAEAAHDVGVDARLRRRQPGRADRRAQPRRSRLGRCRRVLRRVHVLRAPARAARRLDRDDVPARDGEGRGPARPRVVHPPDVARAFG